jgi:hypothetical protein
MVEENETEDTEIDALDMVEDGADPEDDDFEGDDDLESDEESDEEEDEEDDTSSRTATSDDDDEGDPDPDDVEEDLDTILKDRIASNDDEDEEDEEDEEDLNPKVIQSTTPAGDVAPKREDEWTCEGCFFFVNARQFGRKSNPQCPSGEDPCPSFARL